MPARLEIALKAHLVDAEGEGIRQKANQYFGINLSRVRVVHVVTIDASLSADQLETIRGDIFTNPVTQISSYEPLDDFEIDEKRYNSKKKVSCICPKCGEQHVMAFHWIGRGTPRKYCQACKGGSY